MIGIALAGVVVAAIVLANTATAATQYTCPIDGLVFVSQAELIAHYQTAHPGTRIPIAVKWS